MRKTSKESKLAKKKAYYQANRVRLIAMSKAYHAEHPERIRYLTRNRQLQKAYGISIEQFNAMLESQKGACAICTDAMQPGKDTSVDHCHKTGKVRALLCQNCNIGIGQLRDDPLLAEAAARYLRRHNGQ